jgi:hypothetical protein
MTSLQTFLLFGGGAAAVGFVLFCIGACYGSKMVWEFLNIFVSGAVAVNILHFVETPSYLVLTLGWLALLSSLASLGTFLAAVSGTGSTECTCGVCANHRAQLAARHG